MRSNEIADNSDSTSRLLDLAEQASTRFETLTAEIERQRNRSVTLVFMVVLMALGLTVLVGILSSRPQFAEPLGSASWAIGIAAAGVLVESGIILIRRKGALRRLAREREAERRAMVRIVAILREVRAGMKSNDMPTLDLALYDIRLARLDIDPGREYMIGEDEGVSRALLQKLSPEGGRAESWLQIDRAVRSLAEKVGSEYSPDFVVGVYPEGAFVGYLLWLASWRRWPFLMAPDADREPLPEELKAMGARIAEICGDRQGARCLVVDASMKTGRTLEVTVEYVQRACTAAGIGEVAIRTLCLSVRAGSPRQVRPRPDYVGLGENAALPFDYVDGPTG